MARTEEVDGKKRITLCGVQGCCPVVEISETSNTVIITDDYGGKVTLTGDQWKDAIAACQPKS